MVHYININSMVKRSNIDKAIQNIMRWAERPEWEGEKSIVFSRHLSPVCDRFGFSYEELADVLDDHGSAGMLFGIMFEDFLSSRLPPDDKNVVDDYLKRRGWRESVPGKRYLQLLRDSVISLYEIVDVSPGRHCNLRDMVRGGKSVRVHEHMGTQNLVKWDRIAARVIVYNGKHIFTGGILPIPQEVSQSLLDMLDKIRKNYKHQKSDVAKKGGKNKLLASVLLNEQVLRESCYVFTTQWLMHILERLQAPPPEIINRDDEALVFSETYFPVHEEHTPEIAELLDAAPEWIRAGSDELFWNWLSVSNNKGNKAKQGSKIAVDSLMDGKQSVSGTLELLPGKLICSTNSMERSEQAKTALETLLHGMIGPGLTKLQTLDQVLAENQFDSSIDERRDSQEGIDPDVAAEITKNFLDQHYRNSIDEPIPMLDDKTPRQCAKSKHGRVKGVEWLKMLENNELRRTANQGGTPYDSSWIWEELNLTKYLDQI